MGLLVDGEWKDRWYNTKDNKGRFVRSAAQFRRELSADPDAEFPAEPGRYHLYVSPACPWCHRTMIARELHGLEDMVSMSLVEHQMLDKGWEFSERYPDPLHGYDYAYQLYTHADPDYSGRVTVPILWDKKTDTMVNNESSEIIRFFNSAFERFTGPTPDWYPAAQREAIDAINEQIYRAVNNGVYRSGFATTQEAYREAVTELFETLDELEERLSDSKFLVGSEPTEADWRLFPTLVRFDPVYVGHFKCNIRRLVDYPALWAYTRSLYQHPGVADTVYMDHIKQHYYGSHETINPHRIVPLGPEIDFLEPHGRAVSWSVAAAG